jgi:hypothetical protein
MGRHSRRGPGQRQQRKRKAGIAGKKDQENFQDHITVRSHHPDFFLLPGKIIKIGRVVTTSFGLFGPFFFGCTLFFFDPWIWIMFDLFTIIFRIWVWRCKLVFPPLLFNCRQL